MNSKRTYKVLLLISLPVLIGAGFIFSTHQSSPDFNSQIKPIINSKCISCHGGVKKQAGFSLLFRSEALANTESGKPAIVPGFPEKSEFIRRLTLSDPEERMPYQHPPLKQEEIRLLKQWVKDGAQWGDHWAYVPVTKQTIPEPPRKFFGLFKQDNIWALNDIDRFVYVKMLEQELKPSPTAEKPILLRRVSLDLTGLPPADELAKSFLTPSNGITYTQVVDSLLSSPGFGERWASVWLDLARYSDTKGYERDDIRNIWEYRDWVIRAFNDDKPYDKFLEEQLAGDLLPGATDAEFIATAFHRNKMTNDEGGTDNEEFRVAAVMDRVNTTWEAIMGTSFGCVQCHSHPYDPFKHEEYYKFMAFFNNSRDEDTYDEYPVLRHFDTASSQKLDLLSKWLGSNTSAAKTKAIIQFIKTWQPSINSLKTDSFKNAELVDTKWLGLRNKASARIPRVNLTGKTELVFRYHNFVPGALLKIRADNVDGRVIGSIRLSPVNERTITSIPLESIDGVHDLYITYSSASLTDPDKTGIIFDWFHFMEEFPGRNGAERTSMKQLFSELVSAKVPGTPVMIENNMDLQRPTYVFERGNWLVHGEQVSVGTPASLHPFPQDAPPNRAGLARWLTDKKNPLTARTMVNRVWEQLFGYGLVETLEDLGTQGAVPTHRELLDHLSWKFMHDYNWSVKSLIRYIVLSSTYQQDSKLSTELQDKDPMNRYYARASRVRLSAEQMRDQGLAASGLLSQKMFGKSVMPYQPDGLWQSPYSGLRWKKSEGEDQYRRAIYTFWKRSAPYPSMITFDAATRDVCASRRIRTNTPLQALVTMNDEAYHEMGLALAKKMQSISADPAKQIAFGYTRLLYKPIEQSRLSILVELYNDVLKKYRSEKAKTNSKEITDPELAALTIVASSLLNLDEVLTKN